MNTYKVNDGIMIRFVQAESMLDVEKKYPTDRYLVTSHIG